MMVKLELELVHVCRKFQGVSDSCVSYELGKSTAAYGVVCCQPH